MMMEYVYMGAFPIGGKAVAFMAGFFFGQPFFFTSMRYLGLGLLFFPFVFSLLVLFRFSLAQSLLLPISFECSSGADTPGEIGGSKKTKCERKGTEDTNQLVGLRGSGSTMDKIGLRRVFGKGGGDVV